MPLLPLKIPPGVFRNGTEYQSKGRWRDANLVRWVNGQQTPIGGWRRVSAQFDGIGRGMISWRDNSQFRWMALGTNEKLYAYQGDSLIDITPEDTAGPMPPGRVSSIFGLGFGASSYGTADYGTERAESGLILEAATWSMDTWGEFLVACPPHVGIIYEWQLDTDTPAQPISGAPVDNRAIIVTEDKP